MKEQLVSFEVAKLAKEKGFNITTLSYYFEDSEFKENVLSGTNGYYGDEYSFEYDEFLENWNDKWKTTKEGNRCFGCSGSNYLETYSAPTQSLLQKWLRVIHKIDITIMIVADSEYEYYIHKNRKLEKNNNCKITPDNYKDVYSDCLEKALLETLKLIKNAD